MNDKPGSYGLSEPTDFPWRGMCVCVQLCVYICAFVCVSVAELSSLYVVGSVYSNEACGLWVWGLGMGKERGSEG